MHNQKRWEAERYLQETDEWGKWHKEIPFIELPAGFQYKPIPNSVGSIVRFLAKKTGNDKTVSIYLDCYGRLGCEDKPYWEIYPDKHGDNFRCGINDVEMLSKAIVESLED